MRKASGCKPGEQAGAPDMFLEPVETPDAVLIHEFGSCENCGGDVARAGHWGKFLKGFWPASDLVEIQRASGILTMTVSLP